MDPRRVRTPQLAANEPTPWLGLRERVNIYAWMLSVALLAISLWRRRTAAAITHTGQR